MKLHKYQERAIDFCLDQKQVYLAIDMGLGKTAIILHVLDILKQPAVVFAPRSAIYTTWPDEIKLWKPHLTYSIVHGPAKLAALQLPVDLLLINYEGLPWFSKQKVKLRKRAVVFDESSMCKHHNTARFKLLRKLHVLWSNYRFCLSATPNPNALTDLWSQYYLLDRGEALEKTVTKFREKYCRVISYPGIPVPKYEVWPGKKQEIYNRVAPLTFRLDKEDHIELPPITYNTIKLQLTPKLQKLYEQLEDDFFMEFGNSSAEGLTASLTSMKLRQFVQGGVYDENKVWHEVHKIKLNALIELMERAAGNPILCAIQFKGELAMIRSKYPNAPVIAGGTKPKDSTQYIQDWNEGILPLLLCHPASLSHSVNMQRGGHTMLWYGLPWSFEQYHQLIGRLYRQGQKKAVVAHHLVMDKTLDVAIMRALRSKEGGMKAFLQFLRAYRKS